MRITTRAGTVIENLEAAGRSTPFLHKGYYHIRLAVNGVACPSFLVMKDQFERDCQELREDDFWESMAADAMTHLSVEQARHSKDENAVPTGFADYSPNGAGRIPERRIML